MNGRFSTAAVAAVHRSHASPTSWGRKSFRLPVTRISRSLPFFSLVQQLLRLGPQAERHLDRQADVAQLQGQELPRSQRQQGLGVEQRVVQLQGRYSQPFPSPVPWRWEQQHLAIGSASGPVERGPAPDGPSLKVRASVSADLGACQGPTFLWTKSGRVNRWHPI